MAYLDQSNNPPAAASTGNANRCGLATNLKQHVNPNPERHPCNNIKSNTESQADNRIPYTSPPTHLRQDPTKATRRSSVIGSRYPDFHLHFPVSPFSST